MFRKGHSYIFFISLIFCCLELSAQTVSGTVFRDYDGDGLAGSLESGVPGITVTAYDATGAAVGSDTTAADGSYSASLSVGAGVPIRVEFTGLPSFLVPGPVGPDSGSTLIFAQSGDSGVDLGVLNPGEHCQADPRLVTNCYIFGEQSTATPPFADVLISWAYGAGNDGTSSTPSDWDGPEMTEATAPQIGATWGLAYQSISESLFAAAYMKRHTGFGPSGPGAIYRIDRSVPSASLFLDINALFPAAAGADPHPFGTNFATDGASWDPVGKLALGGMDLSDDQETLYVMNLNDRQLYEIPIGTTPTAPAAGSINRYPIPTPAGCAASDMRPFAVKFHDGLVYVGLVCSAESTGLSSDLRAYVYSFNPGSGTFTQVLNTPLDYARGCANNANNVDCNNPLSMAYQPGNWQPWIPAFGGFFDPFGFIVTIVNPQPILSDIEFDRGAMILGLRDRLGDQTGINQPHPTDGMPAVYVGISAGDTLRACPDGMGGWTVESNGSCGADTTAGMGNGEGPGGGEYYFSEFYRLGSLVHTETSLGGLAQVPGTDSVVTTVFDPVINTSLPNNTIYDAGSHQYDNSDGSLTLGFRVYNGPTPTQPASPLFGKANGLGDLETICDSPSIEIGNRVWDDSDGDGVQDPGEGGLANVDVTLFSMGAGINVTIATDVNGHFLFNDSNVAGGIPPNESFELRINPADANLGGRVPTQADNGSNDLHDSDGVLMGGFITIAFNTGKVGVNDHSYDFGVTLTGTIGDFVWNDLDGDGMQDGGEPGIDNVTIDLIEDTNGNGMIDGGEPVVDTTTTAGGGLYDFTNVLPGDYLVDVTDTNNVLTGLVLTGGTDPLAVALGGGEDFNDADFGYDDPGNASIGDFVWSDDDGDGMQDGGEPGIDNVTIDLIEDTNGNGMIDGGEPVIAMTTTASGGLYDFTGLDAGNYIVDVTDTNTVLTGRVLTGGTDPVAVSLALSEDFNDADFGYDDPGDASIGDFVWNDLDGDGMQDGGEPGIDNVTIDLIEDTNGNGMIDGGEPVIATTTTAGGGLYDFTGLVGGNYIVNVTDTNNVLTGLTLTGGSNPVAVSLAISEDFNDADFGFDDPGSATIGDFVWSDDDGDGMQDGGEAGIDNVTLDLIEDTNGNGMIDGGEPVLTTTTTAGGGLYDFDDLDGGDYLVQVTDTNNVLTGLTLTGGSDPHAVSLAPGQDYNDADFGYDDPANASIGDFVWDDQDGDGVQDGGEPGIDNVTVDLYEDTNGNGMIDGGEPVIATTTTAGGGLYDFSGLNGGNYIVNVTDTNNVLTGLTLTGGSNPVAVSLAVGEDFNDADFGYGDPGTATIGDFVWSDDDGDGVQDGGEAGIDNVTLDLIEDTNGNGMIDGGEPVLATTTTAGGGLYDFTGLDARDYIVSVTDTNNVLTGLTLTGGSDPHAVSLAPSQDYNDADFGYNDGASGSIGDFVWSDDDGDGVQDGGEAGIDNVTLDLIEDTNGNGMIDGGEPVLATTTTASGGLYSFNGLTAGDYLVDVTDTNNLLTGLNLTGGSDPHAVSLAAGQNYSDADFGYDDPGNGTIGDFVWSDDDGDGVQDGGEPGIDNVTLDLIGDTNGNGMIDGGEPVLSTTTTAGGGLYDFDDLDGGTYLVSVTDTNNVLTGLTLTGGSNPHAVSLAPSQDYNDADFGYNDAGTGSIGDFVWSDLDGDGVQDGGEPGIDNVTLDLIEDTNGNGMADGGEPVLATTTTAGGGLYSFSGLAGGNYLVDVTDTNNVLTGLNLTGGSDPHAVILSAGQNYTDADFGYEDSGSATIGDFVWSDDNGDGVQDGGEAGIDNVTLDLIGDTNGNGMIDGGEPVLSTTTTFGGGLYDFDDLDGGNYLVQVTDTNNVLTGLTLTGGTNPHAVALAPAQDYNDADFGYSDVGGGSIGDFVWSDLDGDGVQDGGEPGIDNVTLDLIEDSNGNGTIDGGEPVIGTMTTAAGGAYDFTGLAGGTYLVDVTDTNNVLTNYNLTGGTDPHAVTLAPGQDYNDADFGYTPPPIIGIAKAAGVVSDLGGGDFAVTFSFVVENLGLTDVNGVQVTDNLDATFPPPVTYSVTVAPMATGLTANAGYDGSGDINLLTGSDTLASGASAQIQFTVQFQPMGMTGPFFNQATVTGSGPDDTPASDDSDDGTDPDPNGNGQPDEPGENDPTPVDVPNAPEVEATKTDSLFVDGNMNGIVDPGDTVRYIVVISNNGPGTASEVVFSSGVDPNTTLVVPSTTTSQGTVTTGNTGGDTSVAVDVGNMNSGASVTVTFDVTVNSPLPKAVTEIACQGTVSGSNFEDEPTDDPDTAPDDDPTITPLGGGPLVEATKVASLLIDGDGDGNADAGESLRYTIQISNSGDRPAGAVVFTSNVDPNTSLIVGSVTTSQGTVTLGNGGGDSSVAVSVGTLAAGATVTITFDVLIDDPLTFGVTEIVCQGLVTGSNFDDEPTDDPDTGADDDPTIVPLDIEPVVTITKQSTLVIDNNGNGSLDPGDTLAYAIQITNLGPVTALDSVFTDTPDANTALVVGSVTTSMGTVTEGNGAGDQSVTVAIGDMAVDAIVDIDFQVMLDDPLGEDVFRILNQGFVSGSNFQEQASDDPTTGQGGDPTETSVAIQVPTLGETAMLIFIGLTLLLGIRAIRLQRRGRWT